MAVCKDPHQGKLLKMEISACRRKDVMLIFVDIAREVFKFWVSAERARHGHGTGTSRVRSRFFCKLMELRLRHGHGTGTGSSITKLDIQRCLLSRLFQLGAVSNLAAARGTNGYGTGTAWDWAPSTVLAVRQLRLSWPKLTKVSVLKELGCNSLAS